MPVAWLGPTLSALLLLLATAWLPAAGARTDAPSLSGLPAVYQFFEKHPLATIAFLGEWCPHSKTLRPEFEAAATIAAARNIPVGAAVVDFSDRMNTELRRRFEITATPTVLTFRRDRLDSPSAYEGPRTEKSILKYFQEIVSPAVKTAADGDAVARAVRARAKTKAGLVALAVGDWAGPRARDEVAHVAEALRDVATLWTTDDTGVISALGIKDEALARSGGVIAFRPSAVEEEVYTTPPPPTAGHLGKWAARRTEPAVIALSDPATSSLFKRVWSSGRDKIVLVEAGRGTAPWLAREAVAALDGDGRVAGPDRPQRPPAADEPDDSGDRGETYVDPLPSRAAGSTTFAGPPPPSAAEEVRPALLSVDALDKMGNGLLKFLGVRPGALPGILFIPGGSEEKHFEGSVPEGEVGEALVRLATRRTPRLVRSQEDAEEDEPVWRRLAQRAKRDAEGSDRAGAGERRNKPHKIFRSNAADPEDVDVELGGTREARAGAGGPAVEPSDAARRGVRSARKAAEIGEEAGAEFDADAVEGEGDEDEDEEDEDEYDSREAPLPSEPSGSPTFDPKAHPPQVFSSIRGIKVVTARTFEKEVLLAEEPTLLAVHSPQCGKSAASAPTFEAVAGQLSLWVKAGLPKIQFASLDGLNNDAPIPELRVPSFPAFFFVEPGVEGPGTYRLDSIPPGVAKGQELVEMARRWLRRTREADRKRGARGAGKPEKSIEEQFEEAWRAAGNDPSDLIAPRAAPAGKETVAARRSGELHDEL